MAAGGLDGRGCLDPYRGQMAERRDQDRREFLAAATLTLAGLRFGGTPTRSRAMTESGDSHVRQSTNAGPPLGPVKQIDAGVLNVGYVELGPATGRAVVLLHGWPYDIQSYADVAPMLAAKGYR